MNIESSVEFEILRQTINNEIAPFKEKIENQYSKTFNKVLQSFQSSKIASHHFHSTYGYGLFDESTKGIEKLVSTIFKAEKALVRPHIVSGTQALFLILNSLLEKGDQFVSILGAPYETLKGCIGIEGNYPGNLQKKGILYQEINILEPHDKTRFKQLILDSKLVWIQKSSGYGDRKTVSNFQIKEFIQTIRHIKKEVIVAVDNCYGEFVEEIEPIEAGADVCAGSFLKNPGGGISKTGGYVVGREDLLERCSAQLIAPGLGFETTPNLGFASQLFQGLFQAPTTVKESLIGNLFLSCFLTKLGFIVSPSFQEPHFDIILKIVFPTQDLLMLFSKYIQRCSPIDSFVDPCPFQQEGYNSPIVMAGGTFTTGSSIEFSADGFTKAPYKLYYQPGMYQEQSIVLAEKLLNDFRFRP